MMRALLYEAAQVLLTRVQKWSWLKAWAVNVARRRGLQKAIVALARRLGCDHAPPLERRRRVPLDEGECHGRLPDHSPRTACNKNRRIAEVR